MDEEADWLAAQVRPPAVLVGHSWAAVAALSTAIHVPEVRGVVLIEPPATVAAAEEDRRVRENVEALSPAFRDGLSREDFRRLTPAALRTMQVPLAGSPRRDR